MQDFRKKPVVIQAMQWLGESSFDKLYEFAEANENNRRVGMKGGRGDVAQIVTLEGIMDAQPGDWIIRGVNGEYYPCKPDIFEKTYDVARDADPWTVTSKEYDIAGFKPLEAVVFPSTDQTISVLPDPIYGGAHCYAIRNSLGFNPNTQQAETGQSVQVLTFVYKPDGDAPMVEGLQSEQLALVLLDRCRKLNARFPSPFNEKQIAGLEMFLAGCRERVKSRLAAGTMGKLAK